MTLVTHNIQFITCQILWKYGAS